jgi:hypothetical protein
VGGILADFDVVAERPDRRPEHAGSVLRHREDVADPTARSGVGQDANRARRRGERAVEPVARAT